MIKGLATQGRHDAAEWVSSFALSYSSVGSNFQFHVKVSNNRYLKLELQQNRSEIEYRPLENAQVRTANAFVVLILTPNGIQQKKPAWYAQQPIKCGSLGSARSRNYTCSLARAAYNLPCYNLRSLRWLNVALLIRLQLVLLNCILF